MGCAVWPPPGLFSRRRVSHVRPAALLLLALTFMALPLLPLLPLAACSNGWQHSCASIDMLRQLAAPLRC